MKELTFLQIENRKNNLIKLKNDLIERFKKNDRRKKEDRDYYEYEENKFHRLKDVRNLFNQNYFDDDNYEGIEYLFDEEIMYYSFKNNDLEYEEIKKLLSVKPNKELTQCAVTKGIIELEYAVDYDVNYYRVNYRKCERAQEIDYVKYKPNLINDEHREVEIVETIEDKEDNNQLIEDKIVENDVYQLIKEIIECCELIKDEDEINKLN